MGATVLVLGGPFRGVRRTEVARRAQRMMRALDRELAEVSIVLTTDETMRELNRDYRAKDRTTDVLAFSQNEGEFASLSPDLLGDVIVSVPTARVQAERAERGVLDEITMLVAHGLLHLLGWDHDTAAKDRRMRREVDKLCDVAAKGAESGRTRDRRSIPPRAAKR